MRRSDGPVNARVSPPGSKSLTIRALATSGLAEGRSHLYGALASTDTMAMARCLTDLGTSVRHDVDPWSVDGTGGDLTAPDRALEAGESALSARILIAMGALVRGELVVDGTRSLRRRPMHGLIEALKSWGADVTSEGTIPVRISATGAFSGGPVTVDAGVSSQFATALLLVAPLAENATELRVDGLRGSRGYLELTMAVMGQFGAMVTPTITGYAVEPGGYRPTDFVVEPDASAAVYPMLAAAITGGRVEIAGLTLESPQPDIAVTRVLAEMGCAVSETDSGVLVEGPPHQLRSYRGDLSECPDGAVAIAVACLFADGASVITGLGSLRHKESDRLEALVDEIRRLGADGRSDQETLWIEPGPLSGSTVESHGDHRIAMAFATSGLVVEGISVSHPGVVAKTWPGFWEMLDALALSDG